VTDETSYTATALSCQSLLAARFLNRLVSSAALVRMVLPVKLKRFQGMTDEPAVLKKR
jgi:hypothetical protein